MRRTTMMLGMLASASLVLFAGCQSAEKGATSQAAVSMGAMNDTCPFMGSDLESDCPTVDHEGMTIGFCCTGCVDAWNDKDESYKDAYIASLGN